MATALEDALKRHFARSVHRGPDDLVFGHPITGEVLGFSAVGRRFNKALKAAGEGGDGLGLLGSEDQTLSGGAELSQPGNAKANPFRSSSEISIPGDEHDFLITEFKCGGEVNRVISAQAQVFGVLAGANGQPLVNADCNQISEQLLEGRKRLSVRFLP